MKIDNQVCTLIQSEKLKNRGVDQFNHSHYYLQNFGLMPLFKTDWTGSEINDEIEDALNGSIRNDVYAAFTASELGVMIGKGTKMAEKHWQWMIDCVNAGCSGTFSLNPVILAGFVISQIESDPQLVKEINDRLKASDSQAQLQTPNPKL